jgi:hypothetical protein
MAFDYESYISGTVPKAERTEKKYAVNPPQTDLAEVSRLTLSEGIMKHPVVKTPSPMPADYYRRGGPVRSKESTVVGETAYYYQDPIPRTLSDPAEETIANIRLYGKPLRNAKAKPTDLIPPYSKFFLEAVQEGHMERSQIVETFGDFFVFFFGERPPVYTFSGILLNGDNINWAEDFYFYYDNFLRGTKCVEAGAVLLITYGFRQIEGFLLGVNMNINAANERGVGLSFQVLVTDRKYLKLSADFGIIDMGDNQFSKDTTLIDMMKKGMSSGLASKNYQATKKVLNKEKPAVNTYKLTAGNLISTQEAYKYVDMSKNPFSGGLKLGT